MTTITAIRRTPALPPAPSTLAELRLREDRVHRGRMRETELDETHRMGVAAVAIVLGVSLGEVARC